MSKLKHYKGENWEVKVKYDEEMGWLVFRDKRGDIEPLRIAELTMDYHIKSGISIVSKSEYDEIIKALEALTAPKIINEHTFDNPNFKIRIWETENKIGAETIWIKEGFKWNANINDLEFARDISIDKEETTELFVENIYPYFGMSGTKSDIHKSEISYTFTDLCKALERAEQETSKDAKREMFLKEFDQLLDKHYGSNQTKEG